MTVTRAEIIRRAARSIGARTGSISSGAAGYAILSGLIGTTGDDAYLEGWTLFMLDAANEGDKERVVRIWDDATGTARFDIRTDTGYDSETYIAVPRNGYTLTEFRDALNIALRETKRTYRQVVPISPNQKTIPVSDLTWLASAKDIDAVWVSQSPNLLHNEDFALWDAGDTSAPDGWTLAGTGATVARGTDGMRSGFSAQVTSVGNASTLTQAVRLPIQEYLLRSAGASLPTMYAGAWVTCDTASVARVGINNGTTTTYGSYHTGTGEPQWVTHSRATTAADEDISIVLDATTTGVAIWHAAAFTTDTIGDTLKDQGSDGYSVYEVAYTTRNVGHVPVIDLITAPGAVSLIVYARRTFPEMDSDTDEVEDQHARIAESGLLTKLLEIRKPNQDRTRLDEILDGERKTWIGFTTNATDLPVPRPFVRYRVTGA